MTEQHPLTDEMMDKIHGDRYGYDNPYDEVDMRAAADWQLEQVIEWLNTTPYYFCPSVMAQLLQKAMRPQQQQEQLNDD